MIVAHVCRLDEYRLGGLALSGWAVDVGAHIGGVAVALAVDHPGLRVLAVEPVWENAELLERNAALSGVGGRVVTVDRDGPQRYVGNLDEDGDRVEVESSPLTGLLRRHATGGVCLLKVDCEGCELEVLADPAVASVPLVVGEWHGNREAVVRLLGRSHVVSVAGFTFRAVL